MTILSKIKRFYFFYGEDDFLKWNKVKDLINTVIEKDFKDFDYNFFEGRGLDAMEFINAASSPPFGSPLRVVALRNFEKVSPKNQELIVRFLASVPDYTTVAITCGELNRRDLSKKLFKTIFSGKGDCREFKRPDPETATAMLSEIAADRGITIEKSALEYLVETIGCDIGILEQELTKIATYAGDGETIGESDVAQLTGAGSLGTSFDLPVRIVEGDMQGALRLLHKLMLTKESEGTILFRIKDFFLRLNLAKLANTSTNALMGKFKFSKKAAEIIGPLAPKIAADGIINCLHDIYESEISLKSARLRKDLVLIDLVSRLGTELKRE